MPALHDAAESGDLAEVQRLVDGGANIEATDERGRTPLHWAAVKGHEEMARLLVASKANIEATNNRGDTPLHCAVVNVHYEVVQLLTAANKVRFFLSPCVCMCVHLAQV